MNEIVRFKDELKVVTDEGLKDLREGMIIHVGDGDTIRYNSTLCGSIRYSVGFIGNSIIFDSHVSGHHIEHLATKEQSKIHEEREVLNGLYWYWYGNKGEMLSCLSKDDKTLSELLKYDISEIYCSCTGKRTQIENIELFKNTFLDWPRFIEDYYIKEKPRKTYNGEKLRMFKIVLDNLSSERPHNHHEAPKQNGCLVVCEGKESYEMPLPYELPLAIGDIVKDVDGDVFRIDEFSNEGIKTRSVIYTNEEAQKEEYKHYKEPQLIYLYKDGELKKYKHSNFLATERLNGILYENGEYTIER